MNYRIIVNIDIIGKVTKQSPVIKFHHQLCSLAFLYNNLLIKVTLFVDIIKSTVISKQFLPGTITDTSFCFRKNIRIFPEAVLNLILLKKNSDLVK